MKKHISKRVISAILAFVMVFLMVPFTALNVSAEGTANSVDYIERYRLEIINGVSNTGLVTYVNTQFNPMNIESGFDTEKSTAQKVLSATGKYSNIIVASCNILNMIPYVKLASTPLGELASIVGEASGKQVEDILMDQMQEMQKEIGTQLRGIETQIQNLSAEQRENLGKLATYFSASTDLKLYQRELLDFSDGGTFGVDSINNPMDYYDWKYLLCVKFNSLLTAIQNNNLDLKTYYDDLYIVAKRSDVLYSYLTDGADATTESRWGDISLQETMYRYYILNKHISDGSYNDSDFQLCIEEYIEYANDWYSTYELSQMCLNMCYTYQLQQLINEQGAENIGTDDKYLLNDSISVDYQIIYDFLINPQKKLDNVTTEMAEFYARILNLDESYIYEANVEKSNDDLVFYVQYQEVVPESSFEIAPYKDGLGTYYLRTNNKVNQGDTLYLNVMPEIFNNIFDPRLFEFESNDPLLATVNNAGVVKIIGSSGNFTITLKYNGHAIYCLDFIVGDTPFSGGMGTEDAPYLLSKWDDIQTLASKIEYHSYTDIFFKLTNDINGDNGETGEFAGIASFSGNFDGSGYSIHNFKIHVDSQMAVGFFNILNKNAIVKNLTLGNSDFNSLENRSIYIKQNYYSLPASDRSVYVGALVGNNLGTIKNCKVINAYVNAYRYCDIGKNDSMYTVVGGIAGINSKEIIGCEVSDSYIYGTSRSPAIGTYSGTTCVEVGGVAGITYGSIENTASYNNDISGHSESSCSDGQAYLRVGGVAGQSMPGTTTLENCYSFGNHLDKSKCWGNSVEGPLEGVFCAYNNGADLSTCYEARLPEETTNDELEEKVNWNIIEYIEGETYFKNTQWNAEIEKNEIISYPLSTHRVDTTNVGHSQVIILEAIPDTSMYKKSIVEITVVEKQAEKLVLFSNPLVTSYKLNATDLNLEGLLLLVQYNDGTSKLLSNGEDGEAGEYKTEPFDFSRVGKSTITFNYEGLYETLDVDVICYHDNTILVEEINATCNDVGYTAGTYCKDCETYISGHEEIPTLSYHLYGDWMILNEIQHSRSCECGEVEFAEHKWDDGVITVEPTYITAGVVTYSCDDCEATRTAEIPPIDYLPGDINGDGVVNTKDTTRLMRYLADWDVEVNEAALDVNGDGIVNTKDTTRLMRYLAGWDVEVY